MEGDTRAELLPEYTGAQPGLRPQPHLRPDCDGDYEPFFPELVQGFEDIAVEHGYEMLVSSTSNDPQRMNVIRRMLERKVEGVAVMTFGLEEPFLGQLSERNVPLVLTEFLLENPHVSTLLLDYDTGFKLGIEHLVNLGHRDIAFISGPLALHSARSRRTAFSSAMQGFKLPVATPG